MEEAKTIKNETENNLITIDDLIKVDLRVGTIVECEDVEGSRKLYKLTVDLGEENKRTIFAGLAKYLEKDSLIGRQGIFVANLKPRKIMDSESQGMMLVAKDQSGKLELVTVSNEVSNGTKLS